MVGRGDVLDLAASVGARLCMATINGAQSEQGMRAIAATLALADEMADADPVLARWAREKAHAVLHGDDFLDDIIEGTAHDVASKLPAGD